MIIVTHPTGNQNVRWLLAALQSAGLLAEFATTLAVTADAAWLRCVPGSLRSELLRRSYPMLPRDRVRSRPWRELARLASGRLGGSSALKRLAAVDPVYRDLDDHLARRICRGRTGLEVRGVYAYEDGAVACLAAAEASGLSRIYELPIAYWSTTRALLEQEAERLPQWRSTLGGIDNDTAKAERKERELRLAEMVVCPSRFVIDSLPGWARGKRIVHAPFGSPAAVDQDGAIPKGARFRVLFAGSMTQRKGLADVFAAMKQLRRPDMELVVMGSPIAPLEFYRSELAEFTYEPPRPHAGVLALMRSCDALVLPSIVEGRALVLQEAMSQGLPLVITPNSGGEDLIEEGRTGFLVPIRSPGAIADKLAWLADHREAARAMGVSARAKAAMYTWQSYGETIAREAEKLLASS